MKKKIIRPCKGKLCIGYCWNCRHSETRWNVKGYWCRLKNKEVESNDSCSAWDN